MISREQLLDLIAEEKREFAELARLCQKYQVPVNLTAQAVSQAKIQAWQQILDGMLPVPSLIRSLLNKG